MNSSSAARVAGVCCLLVIAGGIYAQLFVREPLFVAGVADSEGRQEADGVSA